MDRKRGDRKREIEMDRKRGIGLDRKRGIGLDRDCNGQE